MLNENVSKIKASVTLSLNAKANQLKSEGQNVINLTAGQLPFLPDENLIKIMGDKLSKLSSYQYTPVSGLSELKEKLISDLAHTRNMDSANFENTDVLISNGAKQSIFNIFACLLEKGDEVLLFAPYWLTYSADLDFLGINKKVIDSKISDNFHPDISEIENNINDKTKMIVVNSPNNPSGVQYSEEWMKGFASLLVKYPNVLVLSDEIYFHLNYDTPHAKYFYFYEKQLLDRTIIVDGVSKSHACTGLRMGYTYGPKDLVKGLTNFQSHSSSGANSLLQAALSDYDPKLIESFLEPIKSHIKENRDLLFKYFKDLGFDDLVYQSNSAFYYLLSFEKLNSVYKKSYFEKGDSIICQEILEECGVVIVPTCDFGLNSHARISLVSPKDVFEEGIKKLCQFLSSK